MDASNTTVFLNGRFIPRSQATLDVEDRGMLFADGVYEVIRYYNGKPLAMKEHLDRMRDSMAAIEMPTTDDIRRIGSICDELVARNGLQEARIYIQVTRGVAPREHAFPKSPKPTVLVLINAVDAVDFRKPVREVAAILAPDERWHRCNIKSLMLLPNVIAKNRAAQAGAYEAILHRDGKVTEGTATSLLAIRRGEIWTHPADQWILPGITRHILLQLARKNGIAIRETAVSVDELLATDEVLLCGSTTHVAAVTTIDHKPIGGGKVGPMAGRLYGLFLQHIAEACGSAVGAAAR